MSYTDWSSLSIGDLIPSLDPDNSDSMIGQAKSEMDDSWDSINDKMDAIDKAWDEVQQAKNAIGDAKDAIDDTADSIGGTGFGVITYPDLDTDTKISGKSEYITAISDSLDEDDAPETDGMYVGAVHLVYTAPDFSDVEDAINEVKQIFKGL